jgi:hypothetical protein
MNIPCIETGYGVIGIVNATPHPIKFNTVSGIVEIQPTGYTLFATPVEEVVNHPIGGCFTAVKTVFKPSEKGWSEIAEIKEKFGGGVIIVGSIISAQAYPGEVYSLVITPGLERAAPQDKTYCSDKFNVF